MKHLHTAPGSRKRSVWTAIASLGRLLVLLFIIVVAAIPAVFINSIYGYLPVIALVLALLASALATFYVRGCIRAEASASDVSCERGSHVDIGLRLVNGSFLVCPRATAKLYITDLFGANDSERNVSFSMAGHETLDFGFGMDMPHIGMYTVGMENIDIYGFFGFLRLSVPVSCRFTATVTPRLRPLDELHISDEVLAEASTDTRITVAGGTDYTGVREYALGDPMKQIHWKLSAHSRDYVTKLQESSRQQEFSVVLDFATQAMPSTETLMDINDCLIETALSIIDDVLHHDATSTLLFCDRSRNVARTTSAGRGEDMELVRQFSVITPEPDAMYPDACQILKEEGSMRTRSTNVAIVTSRITTELVQEIQKVRRQKRMPELYFIVPAEWTDREIKDAAVGIKQLDSYEIPYHIIRTDVNLSAKSVTEGGESDA